MDFSKLNGKDIYEFIEKNGFKNIKVEDMIKLAEELVRKENVILTKPVIDLYISSHFNLVSQKWTPTMLKNLSEDQKKEFSDALGIPFKLKRMVRIFMFIDQTSVVPAGNEDDIFLLKTQRNPKMTQLVLRKALEVANDVTNGPLIEWIETIVHSDFNLDYYESFDDFINTGSFNIFKYFYESSYADRYNLEPEIMEKVLAHDNFEFVHWIFDQLDIESTSYFFIPLILNKKWDMLEKLTEYLLPDREMYEAVLETDTVDMLKFIVKNDVEKEVELDELVYMASKKGAEKILAYLLDKKPEALNSALIGEIEKTEPSLDKIKKYLEGGAENIEEAIEKTENLDHFKFLLSLVKDKKIFLPKAVLTFSSPELVKEILALDVSFDIRKEALKMAIFFNKEDLIPLLMIPEVYQDLLKEVFLTKIKIKQNLDFKGLRQEDLDEGLVEAVKLSKEKIIPELVKAGAKNLNKSLILAARLGRLEIMNILIKLGANNLEEAYNLADKEKKRWIKRKYPHLN